MPMLTSFAATDDLDEVVKRGQNRASCWTAASLCFPTDLLRNTLTLTGMEELTRTATAAHFARLCYCGAHIMSMHSFGK